MANKRKVGNLLALAVLSYLTMRPMHPLALLDAEASFVERFIAAITDPDTGWGPLLAGVT